MLSTLSCSAALHTRVIYLFRMNCWKSLRNCLPSLILSVSSLTLLLSPMFFPLYFLKQLCNQSCAYLYATEILLTAEIIVAIKIKLKFQLVAIIRGKICLGIALQDEIHFVTKNFHSWKKQVMLWQVTQCLHNTWVNCPHNQQFRVGRLRTK